MAEHGREVWDVYRLPRDQASQQHRRTAGKPRYFRDFFIIRVLCLFVFRRFLRAVRSSFLRPMIERAINNLAVKSREYEP